MILSLIVCASLLCAQDQTKEKDDFQDILSRVGKMSENGNQNVKVIVIDKGYKKKTDEASSTGPSAKSENSDLKQAVDWNPNKVVLGDDTSEASGGGGKSSQVSKSAVPSSLSNNPLTWVGIAVLLGAGASVYFGLRKLFVVLSVTGISLLAVAVYPWLMLVGISVAVLALVVPYFLTEIQKKKLSEEFNNVKGTLVAVAEAVDSDKIDKDAREKVKNETEKTMDQVHKNTIDKIKQENEIGKYSR